MKYLPLDVNDHYRKLQLQPSPLYHTVPAIFQHCSILFVLKGNLVWCEIANKLYGFVSKNKMKKCETEKKQATRSNSDSNKIAHHTVALFFASSTGRC